MSKDLPGYMTSAGKRKLVPFYLDAALSRWIALPDSTLVTEGGRMKVTVKIDRFVPVALFSGNSLGYFREV